MGVTQVIIYSEFISLFLIEGTSGTDYNRVSNIYTFDYLLSHKASCKENPAKKPIIVIYVPHSKLFIILNVYEIVRNRFIPQCVQICWEINELGLLIRL